MKANMFTKHLKIFLLFGLALLFFSSADAQYTWVATSGAAWSATSSWSSSLAPTSTVVAQFSVNPTSSPTITISGASAAAAIYVLPSRTTSLTISGTSITLSGATISSSSGVVVANLGTGILNLACPLVNGSAKTYLTAGSSSSLTTGSAISITGVVAGSGSNFFLGGGTWDGSSGVCGGVLRFGGANTFTGSLTVGSSTTTVGSGILEFGIANAGSAPIIINNYSQLFFAIGGSFSSVALTINGIGNNAASYGRGAIRVGSSLAPSWSSAVTLASDAVISVPAGSSLTLGSNVNGPGKLIKEGMGGLLLSGSTNSLTFAGGILVSEGTITISKNNALVNPVNVTLSQINGNSTTLTFGSTTTTSYTIGNLSSVFSSSSGAITQTLVLSANCTLTITQSANTTFGYGSSTSLSSIISGTASSSIIKTGVGSLTFNGWPHTFSGGITIGGGSIVLAPSTTITTTNAISLTGGALATTGISTSAICSLGVLNNISNSSIVLDAGKAHQLRFTSLGANTGIITVSGWQGLYDGTTGTMGRIFIGTSATLTATQLAQFQFVDASGNNIPAIQITGGEIVPKAPITITPATYGLYFNNVSNNINVGYSTSATYFTGAFKVQLSDATGAFANYTSNIIGTGTTATSGTITAVIPSAITPSSNYRVRVLNTTPYTVASDTSSAISVNQAIPVITSVSSYNNALPGTSISITGFNFNSTPANNIVYFGAVKATAQAGSSSTLLNVVVPFGATYGPLVAYDTSTKFAGGASYPFLPEYDNTYFLPDSISLQPKFDIITGTCPNISAIGDLDGDGLPDMVSVNKISRTITIMKNTGGGVGAFSIVLSLTAQGNPSNLKIADIDGDGRPDIIIASGSGGSSIGIYRNTTIFTSATPRTLSFATRVDVTIAVTNSPGVLGIADFDGDGKLDIAAGCYPASAPAVQGKLIILKNNTTPGNITSTSFTQTTFNTGTIYYALTSSICIGDFNGDRLPDVAVINENYVYTGTVTVFKNTSTSGGISFATQTLNTGVYPVDIQCADIDGDGGVDLLLTESQDNSVSYFRNTNSTPTSGISFAPRVVISATLANPAGLALGDLNADGKPDLAVANFVYGGGVTIFKNTSTTGNPSFSTIGTLVSNRYPAGITIGDLDGDGYPEVVAGNTGSDTGNTVSIFRNTPVPVVGSISSASDSVCVNATTSLNYSLSLPAGETGSWSSANTSVATVSATGVVYGVSAGTVDISFTVTVTRGSISRSVVSSVVVKPLPSVIITGYRGVCQGITTTLVGNPAGGVWGHSNAVTSVNTGGGVTGVSSSGTDIISYTYVSPVTGCSNADTQAMPIIFPPNIGTISGADSVCPSASIAMTTSGDAGGKWYSNDNLFATVDSVSGVVTGQNTGSPIINYKIANGCGVFNSYKVIQVLPLPDPGAITGPSSVCAGAAITMNNPVTGGVWKSSDTARATVNAAGVVTGIAVGFPAISYTKMNSCGSSTAVLGIAVNTVPPVPAAISGLSTICNGATTTLSSSTTGGAWSSGNLSLATVASLTGVVYGVAAGTPQISYVVSNTCGASAPALITMNILPFPYAGITSAVAPCDGHSTNIIFGGTNNAIVTYRVDGGSDIDGNLTGGVFILPTGVVSSTHTYLLHTVRNTACTVVTDTLVTITPQIMTWQGGAPGSETAWEVAANWSCGSAPLVTDNVVVPNAAFIPVISGPANSKNLTIAPLARIIIDGGASMDIKGRLLNDGEISGDGVISLSGSSQQLIAGHGTVGNLDLNNGAGANIDTAAHVLVTGTLSVTTGTFNTNDSLELASSDSIGAARIGSLPSSGSVITGKVQVDQHVMGGYRRFRFVSHPFSDTISLSQIQTYIDITGAGGAANGFVTTGSNAASAFRLDPMTGNSSLGYDPGWKPFTKITASAADTNRFHPGQGVRLFFRGAKGEGLGYVGYYGLYVPSATTFKMMGHVNQGDISISLKKGITDPTNQEFNLVGNPYPSPVDVGTVIYNAWTSNQVSGSAFYVFDATLSASGQFIAIPISSSSPYYIQANTAFEVRAHHNGAVLNFTETNKVVNPSNYLFKAPVQFLALNVYDANYHLWDMLKFNFNDDACDNEDEKFDAAKLINSDFAFYSNSTDGRKLAIDARPFSDEKIIPLGISSGYMQDFIIRADNWAVPNGGKIILHDKLLGKFVEMNLGSEYRFTVTNDKQTQGDRFELALKTENSVQTPNPVLQMTPNPATDNVSIQVSGLSSATAVLNIVDMNGVNIYTSNAAVKNGTMNVSLAQFAPGIYMVELIQGQHKITQKLVKE